jgi:hypothetical protein
MITAVVFAETNDAITIENKLRERIIREVSFRDADPLDVVDFLVDDISEKKPQTVSIGDILPSPTNSTPIIDPRRSYLKGIPSLTIDLERVSLLDALRQITAKLGITYEISGTNVIFKSKAGAVLNKISIPPEPAAGDNRREDKTKSER